MSVLTSRIPAAQDALKALIDSIVSLSTVKRTLGGSPRPQKENIWVRGSVAAWEQNPEVTGDNPSILEEFTLAFVVTVSVTGDNFAKARDRAFEIVGKVEAALRDDRTLNGAVENNTFLHGGDFVEGALDTARFVELEVFVDCSATLA